MADVLEERGHPAAPALRARPRRPKSSGEDQFAAFKGQFGVGVGDGHWTAWDQDAGGGSGDDHQALFSEQAEDGPVAAGPYLTEHGMGDWRFYQEHAALGYPEDGSGSEPVPDHWSGHGE